MSRKRVLFFIESFSGGGAERVLLTILRNLDMRKFEITVLVMSDCGVYSRDFHDLDIKVVPVIDSRSKLLGNIKYKLLYNYLHSKIALRWILKGIDADTYVAFVEGYCTKLFSYISDIKRKLAWVHIDLEKFPWTTEKGIYVNAEEERTAYKKFDRIFGVSEDVTQMLKRCYGLDDVACIYNPIDEERIRQLSVEDCDAEVNSEMFNIVSVGRLTKQKGYDRLIGLMPKIRAIKPNVRLYIVGDGEDREKLQAMIDDHNLSNHVVLTGFLKNPYSLMRQMDLFVCSSVAEGFSLVIAEALSIGLPVISMRCAGPCELLGDGKYGILCSTYDELAKAILDITNNMDVQSSLRRKARERADFFNTIKIVSQIEEEL